ncbi:MAG: aldo/keto reductase [Candidatus Zixiibacteriota bacterium]
MHENHNRLNRRDFLTTAATSLAGAGLMGLTPTNLLAQESEEKATRELTRKVIYRRLGKTDINLPVISMGVMNADNPQVVKASYELGVRHFDTAAYYQYGRNEQMVGNVINKLGVRKDVVIATKVAFPRLSGDPTEEEVKNKYIELCEGSLSRLGTDYVDILYLHNVASKDDLNNPGIKAAMAELKNRKKARYVGVSTHSNMTEVIAEATRTDFYDVVLTAINFTMADDTALLTAIKNAAEKGIGIVAMKTLAGGGRWPNPESRRQYPSAVITRACLKWVLRNENVHNSIPGYDNFEHMKEDFEVAYDLEYTPEEKKFLGDNNIRLSMGFCRQCKTCLASCPSGVDIPTLMRTHMYATQYANFHHARATLNEVPKDKSLQNCVICDACIARCANTVDIARRIEELKLIYA